MNQPQRKTEKDKVAEMEREQEGFEVERGIEVSNHSRGRG